MSKLKVILGGALVVALGGTAYAGYVLIDSLTEDKLNLDLSGSKVTDDNFNLKISLDESNNTINLDARKDDNEGNFKFDGNGNGEDLTFVVNVEVKGYHADFESVSLTIEDGGEGVISKGYVKIDNVTVNKADFTLNNSSSTYVYTKNVTMTFKWGDMFNNQNPADYYDTDEEGRLVDDETAIDTINTMIDTISQTKLTVTGTVK